MLNNQTVLVDANNGNFAAINLNNKELVNNDELIYINNEMLEDINNHLEDEFYGWYIDSNGKNSYFLSVFNGSNYSEELIFTIDFNDPKFVIEGFRFPEDKPIKDLKPTNKYYKEAAEVAKYIKEKFL